jgi:hypothetical protein
MPGSCSSNALNGCAVCGPVVFYLFYLDASTSQNKVGHIHEGKYYAQFNRNFARSYFYNAVSEEDDCIGDPTKSGGSSSITNSATYNYIVDEFGNIAIYVTGSSSASKSGWAAICCAEGDAYSPGTWYTFGADATSVTVSAGSRCNPSETRTTETCKITDPDDLGVTCDGQECENEPGEFECGRFLRCDDKQDYTSEKNLEFFYGLAQSSASKKVDILKDNKPQNCAGTTCGEGKDACWQLYTAPYFFITDNNLDDPNANSTTSQKLKFKVTVLKEGFDKTYKSVSGTVKFYYGGTGGKNPCCNDDFDGTVVKEGGYSISTDSTFKNNLLASDGVDLDNSDQSAVGQNIYVCTTIDNISFF